MTGPPHHGSAHSDLSDADWQSLVDYLSGEGTPADRALIQQRLATDSSFAALAAPIIRIWQIPATRPPRDLDAGWAAVKRKAAALQGAANGATSSTARSRATRWPFYSSSWSRNRSWTTLAFAIVATVITWRAAVHIRRWPSYHYQGGVAGSIISLPDGSVATLGPNSYMGTDPGFPEHNRTLHLFGTAHFAVAPNRRTPFIVYVPGVGARVLGTTFTMHSDTLPQVHVDVTDGKVSLETLDAQGHSRQLAVLTAGQTVSVPMLAEWMALVGHEVAMSGASMREASNIEDAVRRVLIRAGAAAAARQARGDSARR
jgi:hypothetical protein